MPSPTKYFLQVPLRLTALIAIERNMNPSMTNGMPLANKRIPRAAGSGRDAVIGANRARDTACGRLFL